MDPSTHLVCVIKLHPFMSLCCRVFNREAGRKAVVNEVGSGTTVQLLASML